MPLKTQKSQTLFYNVCLKNKTVSIDLWRWCGFVQSGETDSWLLHLHFVLVQIFSKEVALAQDHGKLNACWMEGSVWRCWIPVGAEQITEWWWPDNGVRSWVYAEVIKRWFVFAGVVQPTGHLLQAGTMVYSGSTFIFSFYKPITQFHGNWHIHSVCW